MAPTAQRFFFLHLQKTAGTALWRRLHHAFDPAALYPGPDDGDPPLTVLSIDHLLSRWAARGHEIRVVTGHFPLATTELLGGGFTTFTVLRDPLERTLSALRDMQQRAPELLGADPEAIYDDPVRRPLLRNHMVRMLALDANEIADGALAPVDMTEDHLQKAVERLAGVDVVGLQEQFDRFCVDLGQRFGWDLGPPVLMNRTEPTRIRPELCARIVEDNALDVQLYAEAARALD